MEVKEMLKTAAKVFGVILLLVGILGFVPMARPDNHLLGIFHVNTIHNIIHLASGAVALWAGSVSIEASRTYFRVFGVIYALVTVLGFIYMDKDILGLVANNMADNLLHILIAGSALVLGFGTAGHDAADA
jgi:hypothetical protein